ncbi:DUF4019 domain-containing protein [Sphingomonas sp. MMS12-HWE2-04]|uniref:helix-turn-helix domain-containing protein n=1 Tax=Sphingomonas sp. MMS12-HWE2-04 TaxID=3234199 RepID=UPI00384EE023
MSIRDVPPSQRDNAALSEREKATLRLLLAGHDAKSIARELGLSVHTVNERLRDARRKLGAASSREAARWLAQSEAANPQNLRDVPLGVSAARASVDFPYAPAARPQRPSRLVWFSGGMLIMSLLIATLATVALHAPSAPPAPTMQAPAAIPSAEANPAGLDAAKAWVALVDQGNWHESWQTAAATFRGQVSDAGWAEMITPVRKPLGAAVVRKFASVVKTKTLPGAPEGDYEVLKFQTNFAQRSGSTETIIVVREASAWRVAGYFIR